MSANQVRVCLSVIPGSLSRGIHRVAAALAMSRPSWATVVQSPEQSDVQIVHVIGHGSLDVAALRNRDYALIQYCLRTTEDARPEAWAPHWVGAKLVWSYYDLPAYHDEWPGSPVPTFNFYHAPLGVDGGTFQPERRGTKQYIVGTSGYVAATESIRECVRAAQRAGGGTLHLGPDLDVGPTVAYIRGVTDADLANYWSRCRYVSGLRRIEGFELPAVEALACCTRPVLYDVPCYRDWFQDHAVYIQQGPAEQVEDALFEVFSSRRQEDVSASERAVVIKKFSWEVIARGFWERLESAVRS